MSRRVWNLLAGLFIFVLIGAPCCGDICSRSLRFVGPVPAMRLEQDETRSHDLREVWLVDSYCGGQGSSSYLPAIRVESKSPEIAAAEIGEDGMLHVTGIRPGSATFVLHARADVNCEDVLDATHFSVTVVGASKMNEGESL